MTDTRQQVWSGTIAKGFSLFAKGYDSERLQRWVYQPTQDDLVAALEQYHPARVVDVACGTGILADRIRRELHTVETFGVDLSDGMLAKAKARSADVRWLRAPAESLPLRENSVDAVTSTWAFGFFNQPAALREFHRVLVPGGVVAIGIATGPLHLPDPIRRHTVSRFAPVHYPSAQEMRGLFAEAGFEVVSHEKVRRPWATRWLSDRITIGRKPSL